MLRLKKLANKLSGLQWEWFCNDDDVVRIGQREVNILIRTIILFWVHMLMCV